MDQLKEYMFRFQIIKSSLQILGIYRELHDICSFTIYINVLQDNNDLCRTAIIKADTNYSRRKLRIKNILLHQSQFLDYLQQLFGIDGLGRVSLAIVLK